jgi:starch synthase
MSAAGYAQLNTVSENYARELQRTSEDVRTGWLGHKLLQRGVRLAGITNGINPEDFNPAKPEALGLAASFSPGQGELAGKLLCKKEMLHRCSETGDWTNVSQHGQLSRNSEDALFTFIGRLTAQKGVDLLLQALPLLLADKKETFQLLILGSGEPELEQQLEKLAVSADFSGRVCFLKGYDADLANKVYAAGDFFLIPSLYEPCGLTDYMAQLMGNLPIVHHVGGLVKVLDGKTGFSYQEQVPAELASTMQKALLLYNSDPGNIKKMQRAAVQQIYDFHSWPKVMNDYLKLYRHASAMTES